MGNGRPALAKKHIQSPSRAIMPILWIFSHNAIAYRFWFSKLFEAPYSILCLCCLDFHLCVYLPWIFTMFIVLSRPVMILLLQHSSKMFPISFTLTFDFPSIPPVVSFFPKLIQFTSDHRLYQLDPFTSKAAQIQIFLPRALIFALCVSYSDYDNTRKMTIFFLLRWHNRNITEIYCNSFLIQILFLMSYVTLGKQSLRHLPQYSVQPFQHADSCTQLWTYQIRISLSGISGMCIFSDIRWYYILG